MTPIQAKMEVGKIFIAMREGDIRLLEGYLDVQCNSRKDFITMLQLLVIHLSKLQMIIAEGKNDNPKTK
jgi:hypothetical protein